MKNNTPNVVKPTPNSKTLVELRQEKEVKKQKKKKEKKKNNTGSLPIIPFFSRVFLLSNSRLTLSF